MDQVVNYLDLLKYGAYAAILACILIVGMGYGMMRMHDHQDKMLDDIVRRLAAMEAREYEREHPAIPLSQVRQPPIPPGRSTGL